MLRVEAEQDTGRTEGRVVAGSKKGRPMSMRSAAPVDAHAAWDWLEDFHQELLEWWRWRVSVQTTSETGKTSELPLMRMHPYTWHGLWSDLGIVGVAVPFGYLRRVPAPFNETLLQRGKEFTCHVSWSFRLPGNRGRQYVNHTCLPVDLLRLTMQFLNPSGKQHLCAVGHPLCVGMVTAWLAEPCIHAVPYHPKGAPSDVPTV